MISVFTRQGMLTINLLLAMIALATLSGCAQQRRYTYRVSHDGPVVRIQMIDVADVITIRPTSVNAVVDRDRYFVSIRYEIMRDSAIATNNNLAKSIYIVYSPYMYQFAADGKHLLVHQDYPKDVWIHPVPPSIKSTGVDLQGRVVVDASVSLLGWYVYRGGLKSFDMTLDLDDIRMRTASIYSLRADRVSVVASEPDAKWTFLRDSSQ